MAFRRNAVGERLDVVVLHRAGADGLLEGLSFTPDSNYLFYLKRLFALLRAPGP